MLQYSHTAHQRIPASEQTQPVQMLSQFHVNLWFHLKQLTKVFCYLMEESDRNWPVSVATVEQLTDRGGAKEVVMALKGSEHMCWEVTDTCIRFDWE